MTSEGTKLAVKHKESPLLIIYRTHTTKNKLTINPTLFESLKDDQIELNLDKIPRSEFPHYPKLLQELNSSTSIKLWTCEYEKKTLENSGKIRRSPGNSEALNNQPTSKSPSLLFRMTKALSSNMRRSSTLKQLVILNLKFTAESLTLLSTGLSHSTSLERLIISDCAFTVKELLILLSPLSNSESLRLLDLSSNRLGPDAGYLLGLIISKQGQRRDGSLWANTLRSRRAILAQGFDDLILHDNILSDNGLEQILNSLKSDSWIKCIDIRNNSITNAGLKKVPTAIKENKSLLILDLRGNVTNSKYSTEIFNLLVENISSYPENEPLEEYLKLYEKIVKNQPLPPTFEIKAFAHTRKRASAPPRTGPKLNLSVNKVTHKGCCKVCEKELSALRTNCSLLRKENEELKNRLPNFHEISNELDSPGIFD